MPSSRGVRALAHVPFAALAPLVGAALAPLVGAALVLASCATPLPPSPPRLCSASPGAVHWDAASGSCGCEPDVVGAWQPAAPRGGSEAVREKEPARLALRRIGTADFAEREVEAEVWSPSGGAASGVGVVTPPEWAVLSYPQDFPLGAAHRAGTYTVLWRVDGAVVACDGFVIEPRAPAEAPVAEP